jgi:hypothetical protein
MENVRAMAGLFLMSGVLLLVIYVRVSASAAEKKIEQEFNQAEADEAVEWTKNYLRETTPFN